MDGITTQNCSFNKLEEHQFCFADKSNFNDFKDIFINIFQQLTDLERSALVQLNTHLHGVFIGIDNEKNMQLKTAFANTINYCKKNQLHNTVSLLNPLCISIHSSSSLPKNYDIIFSTLNKLDKIHCEKKDKWLSILISNFNGPGLAGIKEFYESELQNHVSTTTGYNITFNFEFSGLFQSQLTHFINAQGNSLIGYATTVTLKGMGKIFELSNINRFSFINFGYILNTLSSNNYHSYSLKLLKAYEQKLMNHHPSNAWIVQSQIRIYHKEMAKYASLDSCLIEIKNSNTSDSYIPELYLEQVFYKGSSEQLLQAYCDFKRNGHSITDPKMRFFIKDKIINSGDYIFECIQNNDISVKDSVIKNELESPSEKSHRPKKRCSIM